MSEPLMCPICGETLIENKSGAVFCEKCDYSYLKIDPYQEDYTIHCQICDTRIQSGQICDKCKDTMNSVYRQFKAKN